MFNPEVDGAEFRAAHGLQDKFVVLYAGAHGMSNDLGVLLESANLLSQRPDIHFVLLGDGKEKPNLASRSAELGLKNTLFLPPAPKSQMAHALAGANVCVAILKPVPLYATVYPNKVFDYMAAGKPVVLAIDGVIRTAVEENGAGIFVQPGEPVELAQAVEYLADDPGRARSMGYKGREYVVENFNRADLAAKLNQIITRMVPG
jgi:glycosyltransferase involved in cell wall biosynthesis